LPARTMLTKFTLSARALKPPPNDLVAKLRGPGMVGRHQHIGAEHLVRFAGERLSHAIGEEGDAGYAAHGEHEGEREHAQFSRAPVAQEHPEGKAQHALALAVDPAGGEPDLPTAAAGDRLVVRHQ